MSATRVFTLQLTEQQVAVIGELLANAPYRVSAPIVHAINQQIASQQTGEIEAASGQ